MISKAPANFTATRNACKLCAPLGACFVFRGIAGGVPFLHGSQGCATYIRRYMISHFKEPVDIASSNFAEASAIFGGRDNIHLGLANVIRQYQPSLIGVASTCLSETIGDDVHLYLHEFHKQHQDSALPPIVHVSTPSYAGTHAEGFHAAVRAVAVAMAEEGEPDPAVNLMPGMVSPADLRHLREILTDCGLDAIMLPDYSDALDGRTWAEYHRIPDGGTPVCDLRRMGRARASIEFASTVEPEATAGAFLQRQFNVPLHRLHLPIGVRQTDAFFAAIEQITGRPTPDKYLAERGRLLDSFVDAHKHVFERRAVVYGEEDLIVGIVALLAEIGVVPVLCATGGQSGRLAQALDAVAPRLAPRTRVMDDADFLDIQAAATDLKADMIIGHSKGYTMARHMGIPLLRVGFPVHDRIGGARILHLGYRGAQQLFDDIANAMIESRQDASAVGYTYM